MSLFLWSIPSVRAQGELHSYVFLVLHSRVSTSTQPLLFLSCFLSINYQCLPITIFNTLPRPKLCIISSASWEVHLAHILIKIMITDFGYLIMKRLIKTGFAFNCPNKVQCIYRAESISLCSKFLGQFKMNYYLFLRHSFQRTIRTVCKANNINLVKFCVLQRQTPAGRLLRDHNRFPFYVRCL